MNSNDSYRRFTIDPDHYGYYSGRVPDEVDIPNVRRSWYRAVETFMGDLVMPGDRVLVHAQRLKSKTGDQVILFECISTRTSVDTAHGQWYRYTVVYLEGEASPYAYDIDPLHGEGSGEPFMDSVVADDVPALIEEAEAKVCSCIGCRVRQASEAGLVG